MLAGFFFGLSLSVASTVVLLRALQAHNLIETERGRIATGWLIVEDLVMVLALVLLPAIAQMANDGSRSPVALLWPFLLTAGKVAGFIAFVLIVEIGIAHVRTPVTNAHPVCRHSLEKKTISNDMTTTPN